MFGLATCRKGSSPTTTSHGRDGARRTQGPPGLPAGPGVRGANPPTVLPWQSSLRWRLSDAQVPPPHRKARSFRPVADSGSDRGSSRVRTADPTGASASRPAQRHGQRFVVRGQARRLLGEVPDLPPQGRHLLVTTAVSCGCMVQSRLTILLLAGLPTSLSR